MPSLIATSLFYVVKAAGASVGAAGTGVELKVVFDLFDRSDVILLIVGLVLLAEALDARF